MNNVANKAAVIDHAFGIGADPKEIVTVPPRSIGMQVDWLREIGAYRAALDPNA